MILYQTKLISRGNITLYTIHDVNDELNKHLTFHYGYIRFKSGKVGNELVLLFQIFESQLKQTQV